MEKVMEDSNCSLEVALAWSLSTKNTLQNCYGFSSNQLVFGKNPNLPSVMTTKLPAVEGYTSSRQLSDHLNAMHAEKNSFIQNDACEKSRRGLRSETRTSVSMMYEQGDAVYYKRTDSNYWKDLGTVIGHDKQVIVKHGGSFVRVHPCSLQKVNEEKEY